MKFKKPFILFIGFTFLLAIVGKIITSTHSDDEINKSTARQIMRLSGSAGEAEPPTNPEEVFNRAIQNYKVQFDSYIDITGLNVDEKESITLPYFDADYIAPSFGEVMNEYQINLETSLTLAQLEKYDNLRRADFSFDKYVALNQNKYLDLNVSPKYEHIMPTAVVTSTLVVILSSVGLSQAAISAFTGAVGTLSTAISTSWIPFIGWILAVALAVGALIALTVIIIQYWDELCAVFEEIKSRFIEQFNAFVDLIDSYFDDAEAKVEESSNAGTVTIGNQELTFKQISSRDVAAQAALVEQVRWTNNILLMRYVSDKNFQICSIPVTLTFCILWQTHCQGLSSYTWHQNTARNLILYAGSKVTTSAPEINAFSDSNYIVMKHFHNCEYVDGIITRINRQPQKWTHSFFGQLYFYPSSTSEPVIHPESPNP